MVYDFSVTFPKLAIEYMTSDDGWPGSALSLARSLGGCKEIFQSESSRDKLKEMVEKACPQQSSEQSSEFPKDLVELLKQCVSTEEKVEFVAPCLVELGVFDMLLSFCSAAGSKCACIGDIYDVILKVAHAYYKDHKGSPDLWLLFTSEKHFFALSDEMKAKFLEIPCNQEFGDKKWTVLNGLAMALTYKCYGVKTAANILIHKLVSEWQHMLNVVDSTADSVIEKLCVALACFMDGQEGIQRILEVLLILMKTTDGAKAKDIVRRYFMCTDKANQQYHVLNVVKRMSAVKDWTPKTLTYLLDDIFVLCSGSYPGNESSDVGAMVTMFVDLVSQKDVSEWRNSGLMEPVMQLIATCLGANDEKFLDVVCNMRNYDPGQEFRKEYEHFKGNNPEPYTLSKHDSVEQQGHMCKFNGWLNLVSQEPDPVKDRRVFLKVQVKGTKTMYEFPPVFVTCDLGYVEWRLNEYRGDFGEQSLGSSDSKLANRVKVIEDRMSIIDKELEALWTASKKKWQENQYMTFTRMHELFGILNQRLNIASYTPYSFKVMKLENGEWKVGNQTFHTNDCIQDVMMLHSSTKGFSKELRLLAIPGTGSLQRHFPIIIAPDDNLMESYRWLQCNPDKRPTNDKEMKRKDVLFPLLFSDAERHNFARKLLEAEQTRANSREYSIVLDKDRAIENFPVIFDYFVYGCRKVCFHYGDDAKDSNYDFLHQVAKVFTEGALSIGVWRKQDDASETGPIDYLFPMPYAQPTTMKLFGKLCALALLLGVKLPLKLAPAFFLLVQRLPVPASAIPGINVEALSAEAVNKKKFVYTDPDLGLIELCENGASILVTANDQDKDKYKAALTDLYTGKHLSPRFVRNFRNGFSQILPIELLDIIPADRFNDLLSSL